MYATNAAITVRLMQSVIDAVSVAAIGMIVRGNAIFRTSDARPTIEPIPSIVESAKKLKKTIPIRSESG